MKQCKGTLNLLYVNQLRAKCLGSAQIPNYKCLQDLHLDISVGIVEARNPWLLCEIGIILQKRKLELQQVHYYALMLRS